MYLQNLYSVYTIGLLHTMHIKGRHTLQVRANYKQTCKQTNKNYIATKLGLHLINY